MPSTSLPNDEHPPPLRLSLTLFLISTATVLFTLAIFKLLSFFIMPSLFFDLLFVGFPIGAFIGVRFFRTHFRSFRSTLWILQGTMILSVAATLLCKKVDYLRAHLFEVELHKLIIQMGTFTGLFIPFFCAYGLSEYIGYQVGRRHLKGRMSVVYALYLFGAAFAYIFVELFLAHLGISRLLGLPLLLIAVAALLIAPRGRYRWILAGESILLTVIIALPGTIEHGFLRMYKGEGMQSTYQYTEQGYEEKFQRWGTYSLTEILHSPESGEYAGFYNDLMQWEFAGKYGFTQRSLGMIPINITPPDGSIAIIGAGGGRQVKWALHPRFHFRRILALEIERAVFDAVRGDLVEEFGRVYEGETVEPVLREARGYMEETDERFDLIYLPSVGGYPQMMLEPGNMIRTVDAYRTLRDRLTDRGVLAIWYPRGLDPKSILTFQYIRTLEAIGMKVRGYHNVGEYLILASADEERLDLSEASSFLVSPPDESITLPANPVAAPGPLFVASDPEFTPISDDQPFLAGNVRHIFSLEQVYTLFGIVLGVIILVGSSLLWLLRRTGDPGIPGRSYLETAGLSFLIGANFLIFERCLILALFRKLYMFHDALVIGAISFLILSGLGSVLITGRLRPVSQAAGAVFVILLLVLQPHLSTIQTLCLVAPAAFVTGSFFPALFEAAARNPIAVFALDAVGAATGSLTAFFLPIALGFQWFFPAAAATFLLTVMATYFFFRGSHGQPNPTPVTAGEAESPVGDF